MSAVSSVRFSNVFVVGAPYSGSTLLGRLLDSHSRIACGGELGLLGQAIANRRPCSCGRQLPECPFWSRLLPLLPGRTYSEHQPADYERVRAELDVPVLVDLSKSLCWRMVRWPWSPWWKSATGFLYLVRDDRAVIASALRRNQPLAEALRKHFKWTLRFERLVTLHGGRALVVHYEDLCAAPEREMARICDWIGVAHEPGIRRPGEHEHHFAHASRSSYTQSWANEIRLDERWRRELGPAILAQIERCMRTRPLDRERYLAA